MKVISGKYKGRILEGFNIDGTRPTMDRVKESLFAIIQEDIPNSIVLDLFSGSGNLGIEALSEGANRAYLVDSNPKAIETMKKNIEKIGINSIEVLEMDFKMALKKLNERKIQFDLIFLDPPYKTTYIEESIKMIDSLKVLKEKGIIICETDQLDRIIYPKTYQEVKTKKYGDKYIVLLKKV